MLNEVERQIHKYHKNKTKIQWQQNEMENNKVKEGILRKS